MVHNINCQTGESTALSWQYLYHKVLVLNFQWSIYQGLFFINAHIPEICRVLRKVRMYFIEEGFRLIIDILIYLTMT